MTTLDELETRADDLTDMVRVTDSVAMENDQRLRAQTSLMMAMREDLLGISTEQLTIKKILAEQAKALGGMIIALNDLQPAVTRLDGRVAIMERRVDRIEQSQVRTERRLDKMDARFDKMDSRQDRMDKNVEAIMRHLGIPPNK
jgi:chaperonin cofactor prefoldin